MPPSLTAACLRLSQRVQRVGLTASVVAGQRAAAMAAQGRDVLVLNVGEPDFDTPLAIRRTAVAAMERGETRYTTTQGTLALRQAIARKLERESQLIYEPEEIMVSNGARQVVFAAFAATLDAADEVIVPAPYWPSFPDIVKVNDGQPVIVPCDQATAFRLSPQALEAAITDKTRWLVLNIPGNPTGTVYSTQELSALADVLRRHPHVAVMLDEIYEHIWFGQTRPPHWLEAAHDLRDRTLMVSGASKTYAMTGWRIGWGVGPQRLIDAMTNMQWQISSSADAVAQAAVAAALDDPDQSFVDEARTAYSRRASLVTKGLNSIEGLSLLPFEGAIFAYVHCGRLLGRATPAGRVMETDDDIVEWLLTEEGVAVVAGGAYGVSPYFRLSTAVSDATLTMAVQRIGRAAAALRVPA